MAARRRPGGGLGNFAEQVLGRGRFLCEVVVISLVVTAVVKGFTEQWPGWYMRVVEGVVGWMGWEGLVEEMVRAAE